MSIPPGLSIGAEEAGEVKGEGADGSSSMSVEGEHDEDAGGGADNSEQERMAWRRWRTTHESGS
jgi:hypothetical protein